MIFVCLGTQIFQMDRLLREMDRLIETGFLTEPVFAQTGRSDYRPRHYAYQAFLTPEEYQSYVDRADLVITHGGTGAIIKALTAKKQVIAIPRLYRYGEHENDHQTEIVDFFYESGCIRRVIEVSELEDAIRDIRANPITHFYEGRGHIPELVTAFIDENEAKKQRKGKGFGRAR